GQGAAAPRARRRQLRDLSRDGRRVRRRTGARRPGDARRPPRHARGPQQRHAGARPDRGRAAARADRAGRHRRLGQQPLLRRRGRRPHRAARGALPARGRLRPRPPALMDGWAVVGGRLATHPVDVTSDPTALDGDGFWIVVMTFEGALTCVRMAGQHPLGDWYDAAPPWSMPPRDAWTTSLDRTSYEQGVRTIRERIARGDVYQVNLCRPISTD